MAKILLVEDNEMNRDLISRKLKRQGFEVVLAVDGAEGIEMANDETPDLILMDMGLPILDGYAATRLLKGNDHTRGIPVIGLSAHAMSGDADRALDAGCDDYDTKPVEWERLLPKIRQALELAHAAAAAPHDLPTTTLGSGVAAGAPPARVLVVDDSPMHREVLCRRLGELGYVAETAEGALAAWQQLAARPFDAVLLDVTLPGTSAKEMLAQLKSDARQGDVPVLVTCPVDAVDDAIGCLHAGADDFVPQPFHGEVLAARLGASLERRELREKRKTYDGVVHGEERHSEHLLRVLFPDPIVEELKATHKILPRRHADIAVLFCDVVDFKTLCDVSEPLEVISSLQALVAAYEEVLERHGVLKVKTVGDSLMAAAGLFPQVPNPALDLVRCAFELKEAAARARPAWNLRLGLHAGPVVAGVVGRKRYQFDLWGSTVHVAATVKARGAVNAVNVSAAVWRRLAGSVAGHALASPGDGEAIYRVDALTG
ncbi:MAG TPA: response regulator [Thermoanaerobaculia bacterium]